MQIPPKLHSKYNGSGLAFAVIQPDGNMLNFHYCRDIDPDFDDDWPAEDEAKFIAESERFKSFGTFYEVAGESRFVFGVVSCYEFTEL